MTHYRLARIARELRPEIYHAAEALALIDAVLPPAPEKQVTK